MDLIQKRGGAVLIGTTDCDMAQEVCTHAAFLINGKFAKAARWRMLLDKLDRRAFILTSSEPAKRLPRLSAAPRPGWKRMCSTTKCTYMRARASR